MKTKLVLFFILCAISISALPDSMKTITGSVFYRERIMLPPNAAIKVFLEDVSKMDVAVVIIASTTLPSAGGPPWNFTLEYDPIRIDNRHSYALRARIEANGRLMFTNTNRIPAFSDEDGQPVQILVSKIGKGYEEHKTVLPGPVASLTNTYWKSVKINDHEVTLGAGKKELHMVLVGEGNRVRGYSGCNQFMGAFQQDGSQLGFTQLASTMKACMDGMEQEKRFLEALKHTSRFEIIGETLSLYDTEDKQILLFEAVYL